MIAQHTPGPWTAKIIDTVNDAPAYWHITDSCRGIVGDVQSVNPFDARLIAAAPDLLAALRIAEDALDMYSGGQSSDLAAIRAAIDKAMVAA